MICIYEEGCGTEIIGANVIGVAKKLLAKSQRGNK
jgi:hypothetical protein